MLNLDLNMSHYNNTTAINYTFFIESWWWLDSLFTDKHIYCICKFQPQNTGTGWQ